MAVFEVGKVYSTKTFLGYTMSWNCVSRTKKTVTLVDGDETVVKRIKTHSDGEYVLFSEAYMGYCECELRA